MSPFVLPLTFLEEPVWPYPFTAVSNTFAALVTHIYLAIRQVWNYSDTFINRIPACCRIWRLTRSKILYSVAILLAIISFILGMITGVKSWMIKLYVLRSRYYIKLILSV